jgi:hypothetical protein
MPTSERLGGSPSDAATDEQQNDGPPARAASRGVAQSPRRNARPGPACVIEYVALERDRRPATRGGYRAARSCEANARAPTHYRSNSSNMRPATPDPPLVHGRSARRAAATPPLRLREGRPAGRQLPSSSPSARLSAPAPAPSTRRCSATVAPKHLRSLSDAYARPLALAPARGPASISRRGLLAKSGPALLVATNAHRVLAAFVLAP